MKVKALKSFVGKVKAVMGQTIDVSAEIGKGLVAAGYAEEVKVRKPKASKAK